MEPCETIERDGFTARIYWDDCAEHANPRQWDNLSTLVCWHPNYVLGDYQLRDGDGRGAVDDVFETERGRTDFRSMRHLYRYLRTVLGAVGILPLYLYDHSGISMSAGHPNPFDNPTVRRDEFGNGLGWDTSMVGFAYTTRDRIRELCGDGDEYQTDEWIAKAIDGEVREYDLYLTGQVYWYTIECGDDELDSCGGFLGMEHITAEVNEQIDYYVKQRAAQVEQGMHQWRWLATLTGRPIAGLGVV